MRAYIVGNGPSLSPALLESLDAPAFGVNRIWKMFPYTPWRPQFYVRAEVPFYIRDQVEEDLKEMVKEPCNLFVQKGFEGIMPPLFHQKAGRTFFETCDGSRHDWHLPTICGYGTVVNVATQIAVTLGFDEIVLVGCDWGTEHFYPEPFTNEELARDAFEIAKRCCPVKLRRQHEEKENAHENTNAHEDDSRNEAHDG